MKFHRAKNPLIITAILIAVTLCFQLATCELDRSRPTLCGTGLGDRREDVGSPLPSVDFDLKYERTPTSEHWFRMGFGFDIDYDQAGIVKRVYAGGYDAKLEIGGIDATRWSYDKIEESLQAISRTTVKDEEVFVLKDGVLKIQTDSDSDRRFTLERESPAKAE